MPSSLPPLLLPASPSACLPCCLLFCLLPSSLPPLPPASSASAHTLFLSYPALYYTLLPLQPASNYTLLLSYPASHCNLPHTATCLSCLSRTLPPATPSFSSHPLLLLSSPLRPACLPLHPPFRYTLPRTTPCFAHTLPPHTYVIKLLLQVRILIKLSHEFIYVL